MLGTEMRRGRTSTVCRALLQVATTSSTPFLRMNMLLVDDKPRRQLITERSKRGEAPWRAPKWRRASRSILASSIGWESLEL